MRLLKVGQCAKPPIGCFNPQPLGVFEEQHPSNCLLWVLRTTFVLLKVHMQQAEAPCICAAPSSTLPLCSCRETTLEFMNALPPVVDRILSCFAVGIGFPEDYFKEVNISCTDAHTDVMASTSEGCRPLVSA